MIPNIPILIEEIAYTTYPNKTYQIVFHGESSEDTDRISGYVDDIKSVIQAIYLILNTERYQYPIYSWDYGVELVDLIGQPVSYVISELPRRIQEALLTDDRITEVIDFEFTAARNKLHVAFTVVTSLGNISTGLEVSI